MDDYLCAFAGKCGDTAAPQVSKDAPETKGFRLIRPTSAPSATAARPSASAARSPSPAARAVRAPVRTAARANRATAKGVAASRAAVVGRADLRLSFEMGSAQLTSQAKAEAKVFAESMLRPELASKRFLIEGHTDSVGGRPYNLDLSVRRAAAVADYLAGLGIGRNRLTTRGYGFDRPLSRHPASSPENRRVEAVLMP